MDIVPYHEKYSLDSEFTVYRPPLSSGKLEGTYHNPSNVWKPSLSYKYKLSDIQNQFTPAEYYRHTLATSGKYIRLIQKLERRWQKHHDQWIQSATRIQALHRGNVGRAYFASVKVLLTDKMLRRNALNESIAAFESANYREAISCANRYEPLTIELLLIKLKSYYQLGEYQWCISTADEIIVIDSTVEDAYYIKSCAFIKLNKDYEAAYDTLKMMMIQLEEPRDDSFRLFGYIAVHLSPKLILEAIDSFDVLIRRKPKDFDALLHRACCNNCLQEWEAVLKDLNYILAFQPDDITARMMRGRTLSCMRRWVDAKVDYMHIINNCKKKFHAAAQLALDDITHTASTMPMIDAEILNNI